MAAVGGGGPRSGGILDLLDTVSGGYVRQPLWFGWTQNSRRGDASWLAGVMIILILVATLPLSFLCMSILTMAAVATCLRAFALHQYTQRLSELAVQEQAEAEEEADGSASGSAGPLSSAAQRRPRRPSLLHAVAAAGRPFNLLHLRLSLVERDFTEPEDYELLLRLDELEAGTQAQQQPPPLPESQLALLPVHVHRTPTKKARKQRSSPFATFGPPGAHSEPATPAAAGTPALATAAAGRQGHAVPVPRVPVVQEQCPPQEWVFSAAGTPPLTQAAGPALTPDRGTTVPAAVVSGFRCGAQAQPAPAQPASGRAVMREEIVPAPPSPPVAIRSGSEVPTEGSEEDEEILCSVCLDPFDDGAKILSLPCRHQYHEACVKTWLRYKGIEATCPNCKGQVFKPEAQPDQAQVAAEVAA